MPQLVPLVGSLVGGDSYAYNEFIDGQGRKVEGGVSHSVFLGTSLDDEPVKVKVSAEQFAGLQAFGFGQDVRCVCTPFAKGRRIEYRCESFEAVDGAIRAAG
jgi:hypothetical protein